MHYKSPASVLFLFLFFISCSATRSGRHPSPDTALLSIIKQNFSDAAAQYTLLAKKLPPGRFPKTYHGKEDRLESSGSEWWCSGFYPGTLLFLHEQTKDPALLTEAERMLKLLEKEKFNTATHDLGFMMFCSFGNALQLAPKPEYRDILLTSAKSLSSRFNPAVGCIKSWDSKNASDFLVIIDNMMNLKLLFWATQVSGDSSFYKLAVTHANTTMANHFRPDFSSYHVINYHPQTGAVQQKRTAQGYSDSSAWARGQTWGLYGFTETYRETGDKKYLQQAIGIADFLLNHPALPKDKIPYWDFNAPDIPNVLRDASAAAIMASALLELSGYAEGAKKQQYFFVAETILKNLSSETYKASVGSNGGFLLKHGVGHLPARSEIDVPLTYGDYYFVEAMRRYAAPR